jgi:type IV pilus assembly protein PilC
MIAAGEAGGILDTILRRLSSLYGENRQTQGPGQGRHDLSGHYHHSWPSWWWGSFWSSSFRYFRRCLKDGRGSSRAHQIVVAMSEFVKTKILYIIIGVVLFIFAFRRYYKTNKGRITIDALMLKLPVFGILLRKVAVAKFTRTMGTMLSSGVAILEALDIVAKTAGNKTMETPSTMSVRPSPRGRPWPIPLRPRVYSRPWYAR